MRISLPKNIDRNQFFAIGLQSAINIILFKNIYLQYSYRAGMMNEQQTLRQCFG